MFMFDMKMSRWKILIWTHHKQNIQLWQTDDCMFIPSRGTLDYLCTFSHLFLFKWKNFVWTLCCLAVSKVQHSCFLDVLKGEFLCNLVNWWTLFNLIMSKWRTIMLKPKNIFQRKANISLNSSLSCYFFIIHRTSISIIIKNVFLSIFYVWSSTHIQAWLICLMNTLLIQKPCLFPLFGLWLEAVRPSLSHSYSRPKLSLYTLCGVWAQQAWEILRPNELAPRHLDTQLCAY